MNMTSIKVGVHMIAWIDKENKCYYSDSAKASGIRCNFHQYENDFDESTVEEMKKFIEMRVTHDVFLILAEDDTGSTLLTAV